MKERPKKKLKNGFTTGTCATIASKACVRMLFGEADLEQESVLTPKGVVITTEIYDIKREEHAVSCAVKKDAGDDPDVTNGIIILIKQMEEWKCLFPMLQLQEFQCLCYRK